MELEQHLINQGDGLTGVTGLEGTMGLSSWATKSRQYLMVRAIVTDEPEMNW